MRFGQRRDLLLEDVLRCKAEHDKDVCVDPLVHHVRLAVKLWACIPSGVVQSKNVKAKIAKQTYCPSRARAGVCGCGVGGGYNTQWSGQSVSQ